MMRDSKGEFGRMSRMGQACMRSGNLHGYSDILKQMSHILGSEGKMIDQTKVLMLAFYIDLSGVGISPHIDGISVEEMRKAIAAAQMDLYQFRELYLETARADSTPRHIMSVSDTLFLLEKLLLGENDTVEKILREIIRQTDAV